MQCWSGWLLVAAVTAVSPFKIGRSVALNRGCTDTQHPAGVEHGVHRGHRVRLVAPGNQVQHGLLLRLPVGGGTHLVNDSGEGGRGGHLGLPCSLSLTPLTVQCELTVVNRDSQFMRKSADRMR